MSTREKIRLITRAPLASVGPVVLENLNTHTHTRTHARTHTHTFTREHLA